jgi:hypothetical protein
MPSSHVPACYYFVNWTGKNISDARIYIIVRKKMRTGENSAKIKEVSPKSSPDMGKLEQNNCNVESRNKSL